MRRLSRIGNIPANRAIFSESVLRVDVLGTARTEGEEAEILLRGVMQRL